MRRSKTVSIKEALSEYVSEMKIEHKLKEAALLESWEKIAGKAIASRTSKVWFKDGVLYLHVKSSVVKNEIMMLREGLRETLNASVGEDIVKDVVVR